MSDTVCRTRSLKDGKTFTVFTELTKPSQSVVTIISSVRTDLVGLDLLLTLRRKQLLETPFRDLSGQTFRERNIPLKIQNPQPLVRILRNTADPRA